MVFLVPTTTIARTVVADDAGVADAMGEQPAPSSARREDLTEGPTSWRIEAGLLRKGSAQALQGGSWEAGAARLVVCRAVESKLL